MFALPFEAWINLPNTEEFFQQASTKCVCVCVSVCVCVCVSVCASVKIRLPPPPPFRISGSALINNFFLTDKYLLYHIIIIILPYFIHVFSCNFGLKLTVFSTF